MKAKVIATGEIVDVKYLGLVEKLGKRANYFQNIKTGNLFTGEQLELNVIDWEQRRFELVKVALQGMLANPITKNIDNKLVDTAFLIADAVIAKLKEGSI